MRKTLLLTMAALWGLLTAQAQVMNAYKLTVSTGTYEEITDGTIVTIPQGNDFDNAFMANSVISTNEEYSGQGFPIGFDFPYNNKLMNQFGIAGHGFITVGKDGVKMAALDEPSFYVFTQEYDNVIGLAPRGFVVSGDNTEISYKVDGDDPNRRLTVQYKDIILYKYHWNGPSITTCEAADFQIQLFENGDIKFAFNDFTPVEGYSFNYNDGWRLGIQGVNGEQTLKSVSFTSDDYSTKDESFNMSSDNLIPNGLTYTFEAPSNCVSPTATATSLQLSASTTTITGSFTKAENVDHYLVLLSTDATLSEMPADGETYKAGDVLGNATVLGYTTGNELTTEEILTLNGATTYYIYIVSSNALCMFGPTYLTTNIPSGSIATKAEAPSALTLMSNGQTSVTVNISADAAGNNVLIAYSTEPERNELDEIMPRGKFGQPSGTYETGSEIAEGGTVAYVGPAKDGIVIEGLEAGKTVFVAAWSLDGNGNYSSERIEQNANTVGMLPWAPDMNNQPLGEVPFGWTASTGEWIMQFTSDNKGYLDVRGLSTEAENYFVSPYINLAEGQNRIKFDAYLYVWGRFGNSPWSVEDTNTDYLKIDIQEAGSDEWQNAVTWSGQELAAINADPNNYNKFSAVFDKGAGKQVRFRFNIKASQNIEAKITNILIEEKYACDYPVNLNATSIVADEARLTWTAQGEEDAWEIQYKKSEDEQWSDAIVVREKTYQLKGLEGKTSYDVQVRARCSAESKSTWSDVFTFTSGLVAPTTEDFMSTVNLGWETKTGVISSELTDGGAWFYSLARAGWGGRINPGYIDFADEATEGDWAISPFIGIGDGSYNIIGKVTIENDRMPSQDSDHTLQLIAITEGQAPSADHVLLTISNDDLPEVYERSEYSFSLKGYSGNIRLAFYVHGTQGTPCEYLVPRIDFEYSCPNDITALNGEADDNSVKLTWESNAEEWLVRCKQVGSDETPQWQTVTEKTATFTDLVRNTSYEFAVTKACEDDDIAKPVYFYYTPLCNPVTDVNVEVGKYSAQISWTAEASGYNVQYRKKDTEEWSTQTVANETSVELIGLSDNTTYEYRIQALCSQIEGDCSEYTAIAEFTTLVQNCFAPTNIQIAKTYKSATITWEGEAANYVFAYRLATDENWTEADVAAKQYELTGLVAKTAYKVRLKSICGEGDESLWSEALDFTTDEMPECVTPTDMAASEITMNSVKLTWTAGDRNLTWNVRYRESAGDTWTEQENLQTTMTTLTELKAGSAYVWQVKATCEDNESKWTANQRLTTIATAIDHIGINGVAVFLNGNMLNVVNPDGGVIKSIQVFNTAGQLMGSYELNTTDNAFLRLPASSTVVVKLNGVDSSKTMKLRVK